MIFIKKSLFNRRVMEKIKENKSKYNGLPYKRLFDIAANLCDEKFKGIYNGKKYHENDVDFVLERAKKYNVNKCLFAAGCLADAHDSWLLSQKSSDYYMTVGIHPCRASEAEKDIKEKNVSFDKYYESVVELINKYKSKCIAVGECGLDYDRFHYSVKEDQMKHFPIHFDIAKETQLPMYLHTRSTGGEFAKIVKENRHKFSGGVVHSFTDNLEELYSCLDLGLYIGVNGCSLKTKENLEVLKKIPLDRIMLETDSPYCDIKSSHECFSLVETQFERIKKEKMKPGLICKDRNEPCLIM